MKEENYAYENEQIKALVDEFDKNDDLILDYSNGKYKLEKRQCLIIKQLGAIYESGKKRFGKNKKRFFKEVFPDRSYRMIQRYLRVGDIVSEKTSEMIFSLGIVALDSLAGLSDGKKSLFEMLEEFGVDIKSYKSDTGGYLSFQEKVNEILRKGTYRTKDSAEKEAKEDEYDEADKTGKEDEGDEIEEDDEHTVNKKRLNKTISRLSGELAVILKKKKTPKYLKRSQLVEIRDMLNFILEKWEDSLK